MIYITGDTHGNTTIDKIFNLAIYGKLTKNDYIIVAGDFGLVFNYKFNTEKYKEEEKILDRLDNLKPMILFVDGNHENFERLDEYEEVDAFGSKCGLIRPTVLHLKRGRVYLIDGKKILTIGGAHSIDGTNRRLFKMMHGYDIWWERELISYEEEQTAMDSLEEHDWTFDYIITHTAPKDIIPPMFKFSYIENDPVSNFLNFIYTNKRLKFTKWYFGHFHEDIEYGKFHAVFDDFYKII